MLTKLWRESQLLERVLGVFLVVLVFGSIIYGGVRLLYGTPEIVVADDAYAEGVVGTYSGVNPLFVDVGQEVNRDLSTILYTGLTKYNASTGRFEPALANYSSNDEATEYTFVLKKGLRWHDGEDLTIDDVLFTYNSLVKNPDFPNALLRESFANVEIEQVDEDTVKFTLPRPNAFFLSDVMLGIVPQHVFMNVPVSEISTALPEELLVGSGPYQFEEIITDEQGVTKIEMEAFADYYLGEPEIAHFDYFVAPHHEVLLPMQSQIRTMPRFDREYTDRLVDKFKVQSYRLPQYSALFLNQSNPILAEERMRKIIKNAFDKNYLRTALPTKEIIGGPYFMFEEINQIPERLLGPLQDALDSYGWQLADDGVRYNERLDKLKFVLLRRLESDPTRRAESDIVIEHIQETAVDLGIEIEVVTAVPEDFAARLENKAYDILFAGHDFAYSLDSFAFWHSSLAKPNTLNFANYASTSADELLVEIRAIDNPDERRSRLEDLNILLKAEAPAVFLYTQQYAFAFDNSIKNRTILGDYATTADRFADIHLWEIAAE